MADDLSRIALDVRRTSTSDLIANMNPEVLAGQLPDDVTMEGVAAVVRIIAAEIDRRIPIPKEIL
jgi:hypothetical protein